MKFTKPAAVYLFAFIGLTLFSCNYSVMKNVSTEEFGQERDAVYLGLPFPEKFLQNDKQKAYARNVWDMLAINGKILFCFGNASNYGPGSSGNSSNFAGPAQIVSFSGNSKNFNFKSEYTTKDEQVSTFDYGEDGCVYMPGIDMTGAGEDGQIYRYNPKSEEWSSFGNNELHTYCAGNFDGKLIGNFKCSSDGGNTWSLVPGGPVSAYGGYIMRFGSRNLYVISVSGYGPWRYTPSPQERTVGGVTGETYFEFSYSWLLYKNFFPEISNITDSLFYAAPYRITPYGDKNIYICAVAKYNDHQLLAVGANVFIAADLCGEKGTKMTVPPLEIRRSALPGDSGGNYDTVIYSGETRPRAWDLIVKEQYGRKIVLVLTEDQTAADVDGPVCMHACVPF